MGAKHVAALLALLLADAAGAQPAADFEAVEIETIRLGGPISMLLGRGGNIGVSAGEDGIVLVDDQFAPLTGKITAALAALSPQPVRFVINTHWHGDHTGGNENLGGAGAVIVAHDNVRVRMSSEQFMAAMGRRIPPAPPRALPVLTFAEDVSLHLNGAAIRVLHVAPAHTDGDSIVVFEGANVIHMGDTYFNGMYPFFDASSGGAVRGMLAAAELALDLADERTRIIPGHGPLSNRAELRGYRDMLRTVIERVVQQVAAGRSADEVVAARPTAEFDEARRGGFLAPDAFVRLVHASLE